MLVSEQLKNLQKSSLNKTMEAENFACSNKFFSSLFCKKL
jgi:hypothetical protein